MLSLRTKLLMTVAAGTLFGSPGVSQASQVSTTDPNLLSIENALAGAPVSMYSYGIGAAWSADGGINYAGGCSGSAGNPFTTSASGNCTGGMGSTAGASANLGTGTLSANASTGPVTANGAAAGALMWDTLTFSGVSAGGATATLTLPLTGAFSGGSGVTGPAAFGAAGLAVNPSFGWITNWTLIDSSNSSPTISLSFAITNDTPTELAAGLAVDTVWNGNQDTASLDPPWTLTLPTGVTYVTASGGQLGTPGGQTSVPEPGALSLMGLAMMASAAAAWRRARSGPQAPARG